MSMRQALLGILCLFCLIECKNDTSKVVNPAPTQTSTPTPTPTTSSVLYAPQGDPEDVTPQEINDAMDELEVVNIPLGKLVLPNGQSIEDFTKEYKKAAEGGGRIGAGAKTQAISPTQQKLMLITAMGAVAQRLCDRSQFQIPAEVIGTPPQSSTEAPAQNGLAYSYGQDNYKVRAFPSSPLGDLKCTISKGCQFRIQGLDCSGFILCLIREAIDINTTKLLFPNNVPRANSAKLGKVDFWSQNVLSQNSKYNDVTVKNLGPISTSAIQSGDIIHYSGHIVFALKAPETDKLCIYGSNGVVNDNNCDKISKKTQKTLTNQCETNYKSTENPTRGVHGALASKKELEKFGSYEVLRFVASDEKNLLDEQTLTGKLSVSVECSDIIDVLTKKYTYLGYSYDFKVSFERKILDHSIRRLFLITPDGKSFLNLKLTGFDNNIYTADLSFVRDPNDPYGSAPEVVYDIKDIDNSARKPIGDFDPKTNVGIYKFMLVLTNNLYDTVEGYSGEQKIKSKIVSCPQSFFNFQPSTPCQLTQSGYETQIQPFEVMF